MDLNDDHTEQLYVFAKVLSDKGTSYEEIEKLLAQKTNDQFLISVIIKRIKKVRHAISRKNGLVKLGFGALMLVTGFLITCINFHANQSFTLVMYSTSIIGLLLLFWGLYDIMG